MSTQLVNKNKLQKQSGAERRREERVPASHLVSVGEIKGVTGDISASGIYFVADTPFVLGEIIALVVEFGRQGVNFMLKCTGEIVRVESRSGKSGMAVKISQSIMESA